MDGRRRSTLVFGLMLSLAGAPSVAWAQSSPPSSPWAAPSAGPVMTLPEVAAPLAAGRYASEAVGPTLTFDLADDHWTGDQLDGRYLELVRQLGDAQGVLSVSVFDGQVAADPCTPVIDGQVDVTAAAFAEWLTGSSALVASTTPVTLAGNPAMQVDATVLGIACPNSPFIMLWDGFRLFPSEAARIIALEHGDQVIVVSAETIQSTDLPDFLDAAQPVIDSMTMSADGPGASDG